VLMFDHSVPYFWTTQLHLLDLPQRPACQAALGQALALQQAAPRVRSQRTCMSSMTFFNLNFNCKLVVPLLAHHPEQTYRQRPFLHRKESGLSIHHPTNRGALFQMCLWCHRAASLPIVSSSMPQLQLCQPKTSNCF